MLGGKGCSNVLRNTIGWSMHMDLRGVYGYGMEDDSVNCGSWIASSTALLAFA